jgi:hypothetical protein
MDYIGRTWKKLRLRRRAAVKNPERDDMGDVNGWIPTPSARQAAWLLADVRSPLPAPSGAVSAGEAERLDLVGALALHMETCDAADLTVCRRLLEHLRGPHGNTVPLRLQ